MWLIVGLVCHIMIHFSSKRPIIFKRKSSKKGKSIIWFVSVSQVFSVFDFFSNDSDTKSAKQFLESSKFHLYTKSIPCPLEARLEVIKMLSYGRFHGYRLRIPRLRQCSSVDLVHQAGRHWYPCSANLQDQGRYYKTLHKRRRVKSDDLQVGVNIYSLLKNLYYFWDTHRWKIVENE